MQTRFWHLGRTARNVMSAIVCAVVLGGVLTATATPALAEGGRGHRGHAHGGWYAPGYAPGWHPHHHRRPYVIVGPGYYAPPPVIYAPPPRVYYAPPPPVYYAPAPSLNVVIPFR